MKLLWRDVDWRDRIADKGYILTSLDKENWAPVVLCCAVRSLTRRAMCHEFSISQCTDHHSGNTYAHVGKS